MAFAVDNNDDDFFVGDNFQLSTRIMVFGVGGAGGNAVDHMVESGVGDVDYVVANTDVDALRKKDRSRMKLIQIGRKTTQGRGAGNNPARGKASAEENAEDIAAQLDGVAMLFVTAGMGGGTGTGAAPVVASLAKEKGILTVGVVTKPFKFEGEAKMQAAVAGISEMKKYVDALIVIPNERLKQFKGQKMTLKNAFAEVDNVLCRAVMGIIQFIQRNGYINMDFSDVTMALQNSGIAHIAMGSGKGDNMIEEAVNEVVSSPLLETTIDGARRGLLTINVPESFPLDEFDVIMNEVTGKFDKNVVFKGGVVIDESLADDEISIIVVATDFAEDSAKPAQDGEQSGQPEEPEQGEQPAPAVTVTPSSEGLTGNIGFSSESNDIDALLRKFNQSRES